MYKINFKYDNSLIIKNKIQNLSNAISNGEEQFKNISFPSDFGFNDAINKVNNFFTENIKYIKYYDEIYNKTLKMIDSNNSSALEILSTISEDNLLLNNKRMNYEMNSKNVDNLSINSENNVGASVNNRNIDVNFNDGNKESDVVFAVPSNGVLSIESMSEHSNKNNNVYVNSINNNSKDLNFKQNKKDSNKNNLRFKNLDNDVKLSDFDFKNKNQEEIFMKNVDSNFKVNLNDNVVKDSNIEMHAINNDNSLNSKISGINIVDGISLHDINSTNDLNDKISSTESVDNITIENIKTNTNINLDNN